MTDDELDQLEALVNDATPGPLDIGVLDPVKDPIELFRDNLSYGTGGVWLVWAPEHPLTRGEYPRPEHAVTTAITGNGPASEANARFYAVCPGAIRALIAEVRRLRADRPPGPAWQREEGARTDNHE